MRSLLDKTLRAFHVIEEIESDTIQYIKYCLEESIAVDVSNVAEWLNDSGKISPHYFHEKAPIHLPFKRIWLECEIQQVQVGILLIDDYSEDEDGIPYSVCNVFMKIPEMQVPELWIIFQLLPKHDKNLIGKIGFLKYNEKVFNDETQKTIAIQSAVLTMASLVFFSCKNVFLRERVHNKKEGKKLLRETGKVLPTFHYIEIHKNMTRTKSGGVPINSKGPATFSQQIRGSQHYYTAEAPLFGKHVGNWWWEPYVRGSGPLRKGEYRVWPPQKDHKKNCIIQ